MIKYYCDNCEKEIDNDWATKTIKVVHENITLEISIINPYRKGIDTDSDGYYLCVGCIRGAVNEGEIWKGPQLIIGTYTRPNIKVPGFSADSN